MPDFKYIDLKECILKDNDGVADEIRKLSSDKNVFIWNLMSSPGAGKTTFIISMLKRLSHDIKIGVIEGDVESSFDAEKIHAFNIPTVQLRTGGSCHLDAAMIKKAMDYLPLDELDVAIIENIGNLVCPAEFDIGADLQSMILSVPEGDDKAIKYPLMFSVCKALIVTKTDTLSCFDFNFEALEKNVRKLNNQIKIFPLSAKTGEGVDDFIKFIMQEIKNKINR